MRLLNFILFLCLSIGSTYAAKEPKRVAEARKSVVSLLVYKNGTLLRSGLGVFCGNNGELLSSYSLFIGSDSAVSIDTDGKVRPITRVVGANDLYDCIKVRVEWDKKIKTLQPAAADAISGSSLYLVSYGKKRSGLVEKLDVATIDKVSGHSYYSFRYNMQERYISAPLVNDNGELVALMQPSAYGDSINSYALSVSFPSSLSLSVLTYSNPILDEIGIPKALPDSQKDALTTLYLLQGYAYTDNKERFLIPLSDYITSYPDSYEGYLLRAEYHAVADGSFQLAQEWWQKALMVTDYDDEVYFAVSKVYASAAKLQEKESEHISMLDSATVYMKKALSMKREPVYVRQCADLSYAKGAYNEAVEFYKELTTTDECDAAVYFSLALSYEAMSMYDEAICNADSAVIVAETSADGGASYLFAAAQLKYRAKRYRDAVVDYNRYAELKAGSLDVSFYYNREQAEYEAKMFRQAIDDIETAILMQPDIPLLYIEKGRICYRVKLFADAVSSLEKAIAIEDSSVDAHYLLGRCHMAEGNYLAAKVNMLRAKELGHFDAETQLGVIEQKLLNK